jgi:hypothetical protein
MLFENLPETWPFSPSLFSRPRRSEMSRPEPLNTFFKHSSFCAAGFNHHFYTFFRKPFRYYNILSSRITLGHGETRIHAAHPHPVLWIVEACSARFDDAVLYGGFLRPGVSLRQGMPEVEVALYGPGDHSCADPFHFAFGIPDNSPSFSGEILT